MARSELGIDKPLVKWTYLSFFVAGMPLLMASQAYAQAISIASDQPIEAAKGIDEVVVTAERKSSTVQQTPISMTALGERQLQEQGIASIEDVVRDAPGVSFRSAGPGQSELEMRGLSSSGGAAPTVGYYLDETPLSPAAQALNGKTVVDPNLFDINRVEVLRGPQGTLYGLGSMGGTIRIITNQPNLKTYGGSVEVDGSGTVGGGANGTGNFALNIPLVEDKLGLRLVGTEKYVSGFIDRIVENPFPFPTNNGCAPTQYEGCARGNVLASNITKDYHDVNTEFLQGARAELLFQPIDDLKILTSGMFQSIRSGGYSTFDSPPNTLAHYQPVDIKEPYNDKFYMISNTIDYDVHVGSLTLATSYWGRHAVQTQDQAEGFQAAYATPTFNQSTNQYVTENDRTKQFSTELRFSSNFGDSFRYVVGGYYSHLTSIYGEFAPSPFCQESVGGCAANPDGIAIENFVPYRITQYAGFADATYEVLPKLSFTAGIRYAIFQNSLFSQVAGIFGPSGNATYDYFSVKGTNYATTPKFTLNYEPTTDLTIYATAAKGFRPGGVNQPLPLNGPNSCLANLQAIGLNQAPLTYRPDSVWSYELGEKLRAFDGKLVLNSDVYYINWSNIQQNIDLPCGTPYADNAGEAVTYGTEFEAKYRITPSITVGANFVYTHADITNPKPNSGFVSGERILNIPKFTESTFVRYTHDLPDDAEFTARISNDIVGPTTDVSYSLVNLPTYNLVNARFIVDKDDWSLSLYTNNLTNKHAKITANDTSVSFNLPEVTRYASNQPLTVGIDVKYTFQ